MLLLFLLLIMAAVQDLRSGKISNRLIAIGLVIGFWVQLTEYQMWGIYYYLRNISVPIILLYLLFQMRVLGAGDIKLFSMIGSILTLRELLTGIVYSFMFAGMGAVLFLLADKKRWFRLQYAGRFLWEVLKTKQLKAYQPPYPGETFSFAFSVPILAGMFYTIFFL